MGCMINSAKSKKDRAEISYTIKNSNIIFDVDFVGRGIIGFMVVDPETNEYLWKVSCNNYENNKIVYGDMSQFPREVFAKQDVVASPIKNRSVVVRCHIQYDKISGASGGTIEKKMFIDLRRSRIQKK